MTNRERERGNKWEKNEKKKLECERRKNDEPKKKKK